MSRELIETLLTVACWLLTGACLLLFIIARAGDGIYKKADIRALSRKAAQVEKATEEQAAKDLLWNSANKLIQKYFLYLASEDKTEEVVVSAHVFIHLNPDKEQPCSD
jgi:hypothetical protein